MRRACCDSNLWVSISPGCLIASVMPRLVISLKRMRLMLPLELLISSRDVPRDRLAFAIGVGREVDDVDRPSPLLDLGDDLALAADDDVLGREAVLDVDAHLGLRQVHDVADRRLDGEAIAQIFLDGLGLGRRLDDDERPLARLRLARRRLGVRVVASSVSSRRRPPALWPTTASTAPSPTASWSTASSPALSSLSL